MYEYEENFLQVYKNKNIKNFFACLRLGYIYLRR